MTLIYKIVSASEWNAAMAVGRFEGSAVDRADGFIHFSASDQVQESAARHFAGRRDLLLLTVVAEVLGPWLRWAPSRGGALFPHLHGPLNCADVAEQRPVLLDEDGIPIVGELAG
ncbi:MAG: DUF952 domain-containing protein [Caulobacteraceae bacterium]